jgi:hypothetical protein
MGERPERRPRRRDLPALDRNLDDAAWSLELYAGRRTDGIDRDSEDIQLAMVRAFFSGPTTSTTCAATASRARSRARPQRWRARAGYRDMLEHPMATTATWNLVNAEPVVVGNLPAAPGRNREFSLEAGMRTPGVPVRAEIGYASSSGATSSDFEYRRSASALAGDFAAGADRDRAAARVRTAHGRSACRRRPFYLGGSNSMRAGASARHVAARAWRSRGST